MKRSELFGLIWSQATSKLAPRFGMSDRGLAKLCERHHIPLPQRGYWAKVGAGQFPAMMPLPRPDQDYDINLRDSLQGQEGENSVDQQSDESGVEQLADVTVPILGGASPIDPVKRKRGRPTKTAPTVPKELPVLDESVPASQPVQSNPYGALAAQESEFNLAVEAGFECQKRKAAELALAEIQRCLPYVEPGNQL